MADIRINTFALEYAVSLNRIKQLEEIMVASREDFVDIQEIMTNQLKAVSEQDIPDFTIKFPQGLYDRIQSKSAEMIRLLRMLDWEYKNTKYPAIREALGQMEPPAEIQCRQLEYLMRTLGMLTIEEE